MDKTEILGVNLFVKKITSLNPDKYEFISLENALDRYHRYLFTIHDNGMQTHGKGFKEWLKTEI